MYSDVCRTMQVDYIGGNRYFVIFIDDHSRKLCTYLIKRKQWGTRGVQEVEIHGYKEKRAQNQSS